MYNNNLTKAILFRPTVDQNKALERLNKIGFNRSKIIRLALDEYLQKNYRILINRNKTKDECPF